MPTSTRATGPSEAAVTAAMPRATWAQRATSFIWYRWWRHTSAMSSRRAEQKVRNEGKNPSPNGGWAEPGSGK